MYKRQDQVLPFFAVSQGDFFNPHLLCLQKSLKLGIFDLLSEDDRVKELGGSVARIANLYPENASFSGYLPLYLKQIAGRLLFATNPASHTSEKLASDTLVYMLTYSLNTDHFLPLELERFPEVGRKLEEIIQYYLQGIKANFTRRQIKTGGVEFIVDNPFLFFQELTTLVSAGKYHEFKPDETYALNHFDSPDIRGYSLKIIPIRPSGNQNWLLYGVLGCAIDEKGDPIFFNLKHLFNPSVELNPDLILLEQRESPENVSSKQVDGLTYNREGKIYLPDPATYEGSWVTEANILPEKPRRQTLMARWSPLLRVFRDRFFAQNLFHSINVDELFNRRRLMELENIPVMITKIEEMQKNGVNLSETELLEYYSEMIVMAMRSWIYFITEFAHSIRGCLKNGKYLKPEDDLNLVYHDFDYMDIAWPSLSHQGDFTNWDVDLSPIERIVSLAQRNGFQPSNPNLSTMARFIELTAPGSSK